MCANVQQIWTSNIIHMWGELCTRLVKKMFIYNSTMIQIVNDEYRHILHNTYKYYFNITYHSDNILSEWQYSLNSFQVHVSSTCIMIHLTIPFAGAKNLLSSGIFKWMYCHDNYICNALKDPIWNKIAKHFAKLKFHRKFCLMHF